MNSLLVKTDPPAQIANYFLINTCGEVISVATTNPTELTTTKKEENNGLVHLKEKLYKIKECLIAVAFLAIKTLHA